MTTIWSAETVGSSTTAPDSSTMTTSPLLKVTSSSWASNFCRPSPSAALRSPRTTVISSPFTPMTWP